MTGGHMADGDEPGWRERECNCVPRCPSEHCTGCCPCCRKAGRKQNVALTSKESPVPRYVVYHTKGGYRRKPKWFVCDSADERASDPPPAIAVCYEEAHAERIIEALNARGSHETCEYQQVATAERGAIVWKDSPMKLPVGTPIFVKWSAPKASSEVFPCTHLGCNEPDGSKCRHWPRGSQKAGDQHGS